MGYQTCINNQALLQGYNTIWDERDLRDKEVNDCREASKANLARIKF